MITKTKFKATIQIALAVAISLAFLKYSQRDIFAQNDVENKLQIARDGWNKFRDKFDRCRGKLVTTFNEKQGKWIIEFVRGKNGFYSMATTESVAGKPPDSVAAANSQYCFQLFREGMNSRWAVREIAVQPLSDSLQADTAYYRALNGIEFLDKFGNIPLDTLFECPGVTIDSIESPPESRNIVVAFHVSSTDGLPRGAGKTQLKDAVGTITLDSDYYFLIANIDVGRATDKSPRRRFVLTNSFSSPTSSQLNVARKLQSQKYDVNEELNLTFLASDPKPAEISLSAFELPEPPGTTFLRTPFPFWLIGSIAGTLLIGLGFYFRHRKT